MKIIALKSFKIGKKSYKKGDTIPEWPATASLVKWQHLGMVKVETDETTESDGETGKTATGGGATTRTPTQSGGDGKDNTPPAPTR